MTTPERTSASPAVTTDDQPQVLPPSPVPSRGPVLDELRENVALVAWLSTISSDLKAGRLRPDEVFRDAVSGDSEAELRANLSRVADSLPRILVQIPTIIQSREVIEQGARTELLKEVLETSKRLPALRLVPTLEAEAAAGVAALRASGADASDPARLDEIMSARGAGQRFAQAARGICRAFGTSTRPQEPVRETEIMPAIREEDLEDTARAPREPRREEQLGDFERAIKQRLDLSRLDLVDIGLRNPLLNYRHSKGSRGVEIVGESSGAIYDQLVKQGKKLFFSPARPPVRAAAEPETNETQSRVIKLQTTHTPANLQTRLLNTSREARLFMEEQGANVLYMALGMLHWRESDGSETVRKAPLIMVPVALDRTSVKCQFHVRYNEEELEANVALVAKLKEEHGIALPDLPDRDDLDPDAYFADIESSIEGRPELSLSKDEVALGFISFGKQLIYRDLDSTSWPEGAKPWDNGTIVSLFGRGFNPSPGLVPEGARLDEHMDADRHLQVMDCDSSQARVVLDVSANVDLAVEGPPGTGKSQTIANVIAQALADGKKVLFVSEKAAALDVVKARMDSIGLGDACLELHSHKVPKKAILEELKRTLSLGQPVGGDRERCVAALEESRDALNKYVDGSKAEIRNSGISPYRIIGRLLEMGIEDPDRLDLDYSQMGGWSGVKYEESAAMVRELEAHAREHGLPTDNRFHGSEKTSFLPTEKAALRRELGEAITSVDRLRGDLEEVFGALRLSAGVPARDAGEMLSSLSMIREAPAMQGVDLKGPVWDAGKAMIDDMLKAGARHTAIRGEIGSKITDDAWRKEIQPIHDTLDAYGGKWWRMLSGTYRAARSELFEMCRNKPPRTLAERLKLLDAVKQAQEDEKTIARNEPLWKATFGLHWQGMSTDWSSLAAKCRWAVGFNDRCRGHRSFGELAAIPQDPALMAVVKDSVPRLLEANRSHRESLARLLDTLEFGGGAARDKLDFVPLGRQAEILRGWQAHIGDLDSVASYNTISRKLREHGLAFVVEKAVAWPLAGSKLSESLEYTWLAGLIGEAFSSRPELAQFERGAHERAIERFAAADKELLARNSELLALRHWEGMPRVNTGGQFGLLSREMEKRARHMPIRQLLRESGNAVQQIKPVFMMSPMSVAKFLSPDSVSFDLVIFDEASQVKPVEALGAIMRGKQTVVVGDGKQLPPTSFFDSVADAGEIANEDHRTADMESILDLFFANGAARRMLTAHYRSRHESLIAVSNAEFYDGRLRVFPSPAAERGSLGLHYRHLPETSYDRGGSRTNKLEAKAVAEAVMEHARSRPELTLGVVAFSKPQMEAIYMEVERLRKASPQLEDFFNAHPDAPFFVKNLENVQGDERDVIYISTGYGRDKDGKLNMAFGPLNLPGGERRLNVLITRAKLSSTVFTNLAPEDLDLSRTDARGVAALKTFLTYARDGRLALDEGRAGRESGLEAQIRESLEERGYQVVANVGGSGCNIDLAVIDPANPQRYLLGVSLDGEDFQSFQSARDRERLHDEVLESLGWKLHRVYSVSFFRDPEREIGKLQKALEDAKSQAESRRQSAPRSGVQRLPAETNLVRAVGASPYEIAEISADEGLPIQQRSMAELAKLVRAVVDVEGPVHFEEVERRLRKAAGIDRKSDAFEEKVREACQHGAANRLVRISGEFLYKLGAGEVEVRDRSAFPSASKRMTLVAPEEIEAAILHVTKHSLGIRPTELCEATCMALGFKSVPKDAPDLVEAHVGSLVADGMLREIRGFVVPGDRAH